MLSKPPTKNPNHYTGPRGGITAASKLSATQRTARATQAGNALLHRYGSGYFAALGKLKKKR